MAFRRALALLLLGLASGAVAAPSAGAARYVVVYKRSGAHAIPADDVSGATTARERALGFSAALEYRRALRGFAAELSPRDARALEHDPSVGSVTPDRRLRALSLTPALANETIPPGITRIGAAVKGQVHGPSSVSVAVLDTGVDLTHHDLVAQSGTNCVGGGSAGDDNGHGTFVAGVIAAKNDGQGVVGVAPGTMVYAVKVLDAGGNGFVSEVICGIDWVTAHAASLNIRVANLSLGGTGLGSVGPCNSDPLHLALCGSTAAGVLYTVAAGNDGNDLGNPQQPEIPAVYPEVLAVTAMADTDGLPGSAGAAPACIPGEVDDERATFSDYATTPQDAVHTIAAPGVCVLSDDRNGGYTVQSGTSTASPFVAGVAALCLGESGAPGPCAGLPAPVILQKLRGDAWAHGTAANGFLGDPLHSLGPYFGYLVSAEQSTMPAPPPPPPPPITKARTRAPACRVPKLSGLTRRQSRKSLRHAGCTYRFRGHGRVRSTRPRGGSVTRHVVTVRLSRRR